MTLFGCRTGGELGQLNSLVTLPLVVRDCGQTNKKRLSTLGKVGLQSELRRTNSKYLDILRSVYQRACYPICHENVNILIQAPLEL